MNITLITAEEQLHFANVRELEVDHYPQLTVSTSLGKYTFPESLDGGGSIRIVETQSPAKEKEEKPDEQENTGLRVDTVKTPSPFVLLFLDTFEKINFQDESEACARLNVECEDSRKMIFFEYNNIRKSYIPMSFNVI